MVYKKRFDGRKFDELRPMEAKVGVVPRAKGSAMFKIGSTVAVAAIYGPRELYPSFLQIPYRAKLRCHYNMMAFSGSGDRVRPGPSRRTKEINLVIENALLPVLDLTAFPNSVVDIFIELIQTDAGTRCAGITAAAMALADAGIPMKDIVSAVAVGNIGGKIVLDLNYKEEQYNQYKEDKKSKHEDVADIPFAMAPNCDEITLLQADGCFTSENLQEAIEMAKKGCADIRKLQEKALREKYESKAKGGKK